MKEKMEISAKHFVMSLIVSVLTIGLWGWMLYNILGMLWIGETRYHAVLIFYFDNNTQHTLISITVMIIFVFIIFYTVYDIYFKLKN